MTGAYKHPPANSDTTPVPYLENERARYIGEGHAIIGLTLVAKLEISIDATQVTRHRVSLVGAAAGDAG